MTTQSAIGRTFQHRGWTYTVIGKSVLKPDSMVYCVISHPEVKNIQHDDVWLVDLENKATEL